MNKPYSESSVQNCEPILNRVRKIFIKPGSIIEIGAGTGQHAAYFSAQLKHLQWWPTDVLTNLDGIEAWRQHQPSDNLGAAQALDVTQHEWPLSNMDYAFSANTAHIMSTEEVKCMFTGLTKVLNDFGLFCLYGPFNYNGKYTSISNQQFDQMLKTRDPNSGIKDIADIKQFAKTKNLHLIDDFQMPVNNRLLVFRKQAGDPN